MNYYHQSFYDVIKRQELLNLIFFTTFKSEKSHPNLLFLGRAYQPLEDLEHDTKTGVRTGKFLTC